MSKTKQQLTYESAMRELQTIVAQLQEEAIGMDELTEKVGRASELIKFCREKLRSTEAEVEKLMGDS